ncbi:hypothetical protein AAE478_007694 [Parahypoxylon ruwenzoriense]
MGTDSELLLQAASAGKLDDLEQLLSARRPPTEETIQSLLVAAAWKSHVSVISFLLTKYPSVPLSEEVIRAAAYSGSVDLFSALLSRDPSIVNYRFDRRGTPLAVACMSKRPIEFLQFLLEAGADPNQDTDVVPLPLTSAAKFYDGLAAVKLLLKHGAKIEHSGALAAAAGKGDEATVQYLLEQGAKQETDSLEARMPELAIHVAARKGHVGVVRCLLENGVKGNEKDSEGRTILDDGMMIINRQINTQQLWKVCIVNASGFEELVIVESFSAIDHNAITGNWNSIMADTNTFEFLKIF